MNSAQAAVNGNGAGPQARLLPATPAQLDAIMALECLAYPLPWTSGNFRDILLDGTGRYHMQLLQIQQTDGCWELAGYFVALLGVEEAHLLNVAVHPRYQGQGWARLLLERLRLWARLQGARQIWLEVRDSNPHARQVYERFGYVSVGQRKNYYPAVGGGREHARVMCLNLQASGDGPGSLRQ